MKAFLDALYGYALEQGIAPYLETREYRQTICDLEADWDAFRSAPPAEQNRSLAALLAREKKAEYLEDEAIFCCALSMGLELGRL
ncbi:MAG: hypothetical protein HFG02_11395 [Oscillibacter sp.]|nr:hypothetical protein [Oscillibacter sp.]